MTVEKCSTCVLFLQFPYLELCDVYSPAESFWNLLEGFPWVGLFQTTSNQERFGQQVWVPLSF